MIETARVTEVKLLGPLRIRQGGSTITVGPKAASLLALLSVERECSRERLLGLLWPDSTQKKAQGSLRYLLHSLSKTLPGLLVTSDGTVGLSPEVMLDVEQLRMAHKPDQRAAAARLRHGLFCEGLSSGSPEFDDWLMEQREHWEHAVLENLLTLAHQLPPAEGLKSARQAVALDPCSERAHAVLIQLLMQQGEVAEAHRQMERCRETLLDQLGVEPSGKTLDLLEAAPSASRGNLPQLSVELVGREEAVEALVDQFESHRALTLCGEGGVGKTTLALALAHRLLGTGWLVELSKLRQPGQVREELARVLGLTEKQDLSQALEQSEALIVLDNCEHLLDPTARLAEELLSRFRGVRILATSREPLKIAGEQVVPLDPLSAPPLEHQHPERFSAVKLFLRCWQQAGGRPPNELETVAEICRRLDGLPLALELAAARGRVLAPAQVLERLDQRFRLLTGGRRTSESRQQTLYGLIEWSYELLDEEDRRGLCWLSVFRSGFTLDTACEVLDRDEWDTLDQLTRLQEKSLLRTEPSACGLRYRMLESIRDFAQEQLSRREETGLARDSHLASFLSLAQRVCPLTRGQEQRLWLDRLDSETSNFQAALEWALETRPGEALELTSALCPLWKDRDHRREGLEALEAALRRSPPEHSERGRGLLLKAEIELQLGQRETALKTFEVALDLARTADRKMDACRALKGLGSTFFFLEQYGEAARCYEEACEGYLQLEDQHEVANCTNNLGLVEQYRRRHQEARKLLLAARDQYHSAGDAKGVGIAVGNLAYLALEEGEAEEALTLYQESLQVLNKVGALWNCAYFLEGLGRTLSELHRFEDGIRPLAVAQRLRDELRTPRQGAEVAVVEAVLKRLRLSLGERFEPMWEQSRGLKPAQVITL